MSLVDFGEVTFAYKIAILVNIVFDLFASLRGHVFLSGSGVSAWEHGVISGVFSKVNILYNLLEVFICFI